MKRVYLNELGANRLLGNGDWFSNLPVDVRESQEGKFADEIYTTDGKYIGGCLSAEGYSEKAPDQLLVNFALGNFNEAFPG